MYYDVIVFDIDGTLWDACAVSTKGMNRALASLQVPHTITVEDIKRVTGKPQDQAMQILFKDLRPDASMLRELDAGERKAIEEEGGILFEGVTEGFRKLSEQARLFLVSNCQQWYLEDFVRFSGLGKFLSGSSCYGSSGTSKAEMLSDIVRKENAKKAVYIGDTSGDREAAASAKIDFIGAAYGFGDVSASSVTFDSFPKITEFLLGL